MAQEELLMIKKNNSIIDLLLIEALLQSNISTYKISKATQIPNSTILIYVMVSANSKILLLKMA